MPQNPDIRWRQRLQSFRRAHRQLSDAVVLAGKRKLSELEQQGLIQAFEFTHELAWNMMKDFLESHGAIDLYGSKDATRQAFAKGLIENGEVWMQMIKSRNQTTHTYNQSTANMIGKAIVSSYLAEFDQFLRRFTELEVNEP